MLEEEQPTAASEGNNLIGQSKLSTGQNMGTLRLVYRK